MDLSSLNENQYKGVTTTSKYTRIVAGAGSGKTRVLTYRIAYLLENQLASPYGILGITFTNKAASEIKTRVVDLLGASFNMSLCTIHSWCARFLRREYAHINYQRNFIILDEEDSMKVVKDVFEKNNLSKKDPLLKKFYNWMCNKKMQGIQYKDIEHEVYPNSEMRQFQKFFKEYTEKLFAMQALDFDDLLLKAIEVLKDESNGVAKRYQRIISHILVDEFQDINDVQFELITLLMDKSTELYVVGDPDQTIYTWRGANNDIIMNFSDNLKKLFGDGNVETIILNENYRSTKNILKSANKLIANNKHRVEKDLISLQEEGENISVFRAYNALNEATYVANTIKELHYDGVSYNDIAILYRANYLSREVESQLNLKTIPYKVYGGLKFYQRKEIKDLIAYFTLFLNQDADIAFSRIVNVPKRNIGQATLDKLQEGANAYGQSLYHYILENEDLPINGSKKAVLKSLIELLEKTREKIFNAENKETIPDILEQFLIDIDYEKELNEEEDKKEDRQENIQELLTSMRNYFFDADNPTFEEFIENCILQSSQDEVFDGDFVTLMTVHTAKGLEYKYVFVYGLNDGVFPSKRAIEESKTGLEEERRLAYVAFTRAKKKLYLTSNEEFSYMLGFKPDPSRFLFEAGLMKRKEDNRPSYMPNNSWEQMRKQMNQIKQESKPISKPQVVNKTNGIKDWKVGDMVSHEAFGIGHVIEVRGTLITVKFNDNKFATKTLVGSHHMISRIYN